MSKRKNNPKLDGAIVFYYEPNRSAPWKSQASTGVTATADNRQPFVREVRIQLLLTTHKI